MDSKEIVELVQSDADSTELAPTEANRLQKMASEIRMVIPESESECWDEVVRFEESTLQLEAKKGLLLLKLRNEAEHGEFKKKLALHGIAKSSASRSMSIAKFFLGLSDSKVSTSRLLGLKKSHIAELSQLSVDVIEKLDDDELDELSDLSVRALRDKVKKLRAENQALDEQRADAINALAEEQMSNRPETVHGLPTWEVQIRKEAIAYTAVMDEAISVLAEQIRVIKSNSISDHQHTAANTITHAWGGAIKRALALLDDLSLSTGVGAGIDEMPQFMESEWQNIEADRRRLIDQFTVLLPKEG